MLGHARRYIGGCRCAHDVRRNEREPVKEWMMELTKPQIEELRTRLDSRSATLRSASRPSSPSLITEGDSRSPEELEQEPPGAEAANVIDDLHSGELRDIEAARGRLAKGLYGTCVDCGLAIPYARLQA